MWTPDFVFLVYLTKVWYNNNDFVSNTRPFMQKRT